MLFVVLSYFVILPSTKAEPYLSVASKLPCQSCHVNPTGGGMRNDYGRIFGINQLPESDKEPINLELAKLSPAIQIGANFRYNFNLQKNALDDIDQKSFEVDSGQIYLLFSNQNQDLSLYLDQQVAPGAAINREAYVLKKFESGNYLKVGKFMPALGLKLEDDSAFTRQVTGFNFDNSDNGVEYDIITGNAMYSLFITNGTQGVSNDDDKFQLGARGEFFLDSWRLGGALVNNSSNDFDQSIISIFAGYTFKSLTFLAEVVDIEKQSNIELQDDKKIRVALLEANWKVASGHNLKLTEEFHDPDANREEDHRVRHSLIYEYTPWAYFQIRTGLRFKESPPQNQVEETDKFFIQTHFYF